MMKRFWFGFFWLMMLAAAACSHLDQQASPAPHLQPDTATVRLVIDTASGQVVVPLSMFGLSRRATFTLETTGFTYGDLILLNDSTLAYRATSTENWPVDSGMVHVCQGGVCADRHVRVVNPGYREPMSGGCADLGLVRTLPVVNLGNAVLSNLPGLSEAGAEIDSIWGFLHLAQIRTGGQAISYGAAGGEAAGYYLGWDEIYYRVKRPNGLGCYTGRIAVVIPDTCSEPRARNDTFTVPWTAGALSINSFLGNDTACDGTTSNNADFHLGWRAYSRPYHFWTRYGTFVDTTNSFGTPFLYYKMTDPVGNRPSADTLIYYMEDENNGRITPARLILNF